MKTHANKTQGNKSKASANSFPVEQSRRQSRVQFIDNRPETIAQRKLQEIVDNSPQVKRSRAFRVMANNHVAQAYFDAPHPSEIVRARQYIEKNRPDLLEEFDHLEGTDNDEGYLFDWLEKNKIGYHAIYDWLDTLEAAGGMEPGEREKPTGLALYLDEPGNEPSTSSAPVGNLPSPSTAPVAPLDSRSIAEAKRSLTAWGGRPQLNRQERNDALEAFAAVEKAGRMDADALRIVGEILNAQSEDIKIYESSGLANKKNLRLEQQRIMQEKINVLRLYTQKESDITLPVDIIRDGGDTVEKVNIKGEKFQIATSYEALTARDGAATGTEASGSPASDYLRNTYGRNVAFVAGHLVGRKIGGLAEPKNLAPFTNEFNTSQMRSPEAYAEGLLRSGKVIHYQARVTSFSPASLMLVVDKQDQELVVSEMAVTVTERALVRDGDPSDIRAWKVPKKSKEFKPTV